jgi:hypothetical protein
MRAVYLEVRQSEVEGKTMQLLPRIFGCKTLCSFGRNSLALLFQLLDFSLERCLVSHALVRTLTAEDAKLDFGDVQPAAMFGRVVEIQLPQDTACCCGGACRLQRSRLMRVQAIEQGDCTHGHGVRIVQHTLAVGRALGHQLFTRFITPDDRIQLAIFVHRVCSSRARCTPLRPGAFFASL